MPAVQLIGNRSIRLVGFGVFVSGITVIASLNSFKVTVITNTGDVFSAGGDGLDIEPPDAHFIQNVKDANLVMNNRCSTDNEGNVYLLLGKRLRNFNSKYELGYLFLYIKTDVFYSSYSDLVLKDSSSYVTVNDLVITHTNKNLVGTVQLLPKTQGVHINDITFTADNKYIIGNYALDRVSLLGKWSMVNTIPYGSIKQTISAINNYLTFIVLFITLVALALIFFMSNRLSKPILNLKNKMMAFSEEKENYLPLVREKNEIWQLVNSYNYLILRINDLIEKNNEEKEKQKKDTSP